MLRLSCDEFCNYLKHFQGTEDIIRSIETAIDQCITANCIGNALDDHIAILGDACLTDDKRTEYNLQHIAEWLVLMVWHHKLDHNHLPRQMLWLHH